MGFRLIFSLFYLTNDHDSRSTFKGFHRTGVVEEAKCYGNNTTQIASPFFPSLPSPSSSLASSLGPAAWCVRVLGLFALRCLRSSDLASRLRWPWPLLAVGTCRVLGSCALRCLMKACHGYSGCGLSSVFFAASRRLAPQANILENQ